MPLTASFAISSNQKFLSYKGLEIGRSTTFSPEEGIITLDLHELPSNAIVGVIGLIQAELPGSLKVIVSPVKDKKIVDDIQPTMTVKNGRTKVLPLFPEIEVRVWE